MQLGIKAAFEEANDAGGVHGRKLQLVSEDDYYEPEAAIANTTSLIDDKGVFALIGAVGTPTSVQPSRGRIEGSTLHCTFHWCWAAAG